MTILGGISGGLLPVSIDQVIIDVVSISVKGYFQLLGIQASLDAVTEVNVENVPNGKIYHLKLKVKAVVGSAYVWKLCTCDVVAPNFLPPYVKDFSYVEDIGV